MSGAHENPHPGKCWGCFKRHLGWCDKNQRPGKLTCWWHRDCENAAQRLRKQLEERKG